MIQQFVEATNLYGIAKLGEQWTNTDADEIHKLIVVVIYMGINHSATLRHYWARDSRSPFVTALFPSRDRFLILYRCFYINTGERDSEDPLWHVRPLVDSLNISFPKHHSPERDLVFDEMMIACKARSRLKQYLKGKPHKWGYKVWCLESGGYVQNFSIYNGNRVGLPKESPSKALERMVTPYQGNHHLIYMNNLFSSPELSRSLLEKQIYSSGTARTNRIDFPKSLTENVPKKQRGYWRFLQKGKLVAYLFVDKKPVYFLSTFHSPTRTRNITRRDKKGKRIDLVVPEIVDYYNMFRGRVDRLDQFLAYYPMPRKSRRPWPRLAWWLIELCTINAHRLYEIKQNAKFTLLDTRQRLMHELAGDISVPLSHSKLTRMTFTHMNQIGHWPAKTLSQGRCYYCYHVKKIRKDVTNKCGLCDKYLCIYDCFKLHHIAPA